jgi:hypothetical protein
MFLFRVSYFQGSLLHKPYHLHTSIYLKLVRLIKKLKLTESSNFVILELPFVSGAIRPCPNTLPMLLVVSPRPVVSGSNSHVLSVDLVLFKTFLVLNLLSSCLRDPVGSSVLRNGLHTSAVLHIVSPASLVDDVATVLGLLSFARSLTIVPSSEVVVTLLVLVVDELLLRMST